MNGHESRLFARSLALAIICTLFVLLIQGLGVLSSFEDWLYDLRAAHAQFAAPAPSKRIAHLDIDDAALDAIGRWPWPRATQARILDEVRRAQPAAVGLDIFFGEPSIKHLDQQSDGTTRLVDDDALLAASLKRLGCAILAVTFHLEPEEKQYPGLPSALACLKKNLELSTDDLRRAIGPAAASMDTQSLDDLYVHARRIAMRERIDEELLAGRDQLPQLAANLLPQSDPTVDTPLTRLLEKQFILATADRSVRKVGIPAVQLTPPPLAGDLDEVPLSNFTDAVAACGFVNYDIFGNATVRSIPLIVQYKDRLYPQFGLSLACVALGADPKRIRMGDGEILISTRDGDLRIPTYTYHSSSAGKDVPLIGAIPWFGSSDWDTMYDWPAHLDSSAHVSISKAWDVCVSEDVIARNSSEIDKGLSELLDEDLAHKLTLGLDPDLGKKYAANRPDPQDVDAREAIVAQAFKELKDAGWVEMYDAMAEKDMTVEDKLFRTHLHDAVHALQAAIARNREARADLNAQRLDLSSRLGGKAVLIGLTATGLVDSVHTSLHLHAPGVVVHGVIANAVLTKYWWHNAPSWIAFAITILFGISTGWAQGKLSPLRAGLFALGLVILYFAFNWAILFALERTILKMAGPVTVIAVVWAVCTLHHLISEGVERIRIGTENEIFQKEMALARKVQFALVPAKAPETPGINADGWTLPADMTGGDLFDLWHLPDGRLGILVADASGHGLAPAMIVSQVRTLVHMLSEYEASPHSLLRRVNTRLSLDLETGRFVTAFLAFLKCDGEFEWASAGHGPMYWSPRGDGELLELDSSGLPLGVQEDWLADDPSPPLKLEPTGRLIVFSDGIFEAHGPTPKAGLFGTDAIKEILLKSPQADATQIIHNIRDAVQAFQGKKEPVDDQTIVVVRRVTAEESRIDGEGVYQVSSNAQMTVEVECPAVQISQNE